MAMVVKNNMSAVSTLNTLNKNSSALQKSLAKVSSGMKINSAQDDASGYAISEKMRVQIRSLDQANQNTQNASSLMKTAEGAVSSTVEILKSLKEKAINAATDTNTDADRVTIQKEVDQFIDQIDDNALTTFNGKYLVDGSKAQQGKATYTAMTNQSLATDTDGTTKLTALKNRNNEELEISSTDYVTVSYVQNGKTYTTKSSQVGSDMTLQDVFQLAEDIDTDSTVFANATNKVMQHFDSTLESKANNISSLESARDSAKTALETAQSDYDTAAAAEANATTTIADGTAALGTIDLANSDNSTGHIKDLQKAVEAWNAKASAQSIDTSSATDEKSYITAAKSGLDNKATSANASAFSATTEQTALQAAYDAAKADQDKIDTDTSALAADTAAKKTALDTAQTNYTNAANAYKEAAGPVLMKDGNVGVNTAGDDVKTADGTNGVTVTAQSNGIKNQISGITISITDSEGNVKKSANAALDQFKTTVYAKNDSDRNEMTFQVGASANQSITVGLDDMRAEALGLKSSDGQKVSVATQDNANAAVAVFDNAIQKALDQQTTIGAVEARLDYTGSNLTTMSENVQSAESTIRDADMAKEMTNYTKNNVLLQAAQSMLAQANQSSSAVLSLLQ